MKAKLRLVAGQPTMKKRRPNLTVQYVEAPNAPTGDEHYALEKFELAVHSLCTHEGRIGDRIYHVYMEHLHAVSRRDLPSPYGEEWEKIKTRLTRNPPKNSRDSAIWATMRGLRNAEASRIADRILHIRDGLRRLLQVD